MLRECAGCQIQFAPNERERRVRRWCSEACRLRVFRRVHPEYAARTSQRNAERARAAYVPPSYDKSCAACGQSFIAARSNRKYCSTTCARRAYSAARRADGRAADLSATRRAREKGAKLSRGRRRDVLDRDEWVCQLCGHTTNREARYPAWDFAVIDHVVPLSDGGAHEMSNWQTAHSYCNALKRDLSLDEFRVLFSDIEAVMSERLALAA